MTPFEWGVTEQSGFANGTFVRSENLKPLEPKLEHDKGQHLRTHIKTLLGKIGSRNSNLKRKGRLTYAFQGDTLLMYAVIGHVQNSVVKVLFMLLFFSRKWTRRPHVT